MQSVATGGSRSRVRRVASTQSASRDRRWGSQSPRLAPTREINQRPRGLARRAAPQLAEHLCLTGRGRPHPTRQSSAATSPLIIHVPPQQIACSGGPASLRLRHHAAGDSQSSLSTAGSRATVALYNQPLPRVGHALHGSLSVPWTGVAGCVRVPMALRAGSLLLFAAARPSALTAPWVRSMTHDHYSALDSASADWYYLDPDLQARVVGLPLGSRVHRGQAPRIGTLIVTPDRRERGAPRRQPAPADATTVGTDRTVVHHPSTCTRSGPLESVTLGFRRGCEGRAARRPGVVYAGTATSVPSHRVCGSLV